MRLHKSNTPRLTPFAPELRVVKFIATRRGDPERGPMIWLNPTDAQTRLLMDGELAYVEGPRWKQQLAPVIIDESVPEHTCVIRDVIGIAPSESVRVTKPNFDKPAPPNSPDPSTPSAV